MLSIIAAIARNGVIGCNNQLPWHLPSDLKHFKQITMGKPLIMGRKTFESIGKPLPGRTTIVVTNSPAWSAPHVHAVHSTEAALTLANDIARASGTNEVMVIGGAHLYQTMLAMADRMYITKIHADIIGDTHFPEVNSNEWIETAREDHKKTTGNPFDYSFVTYDKIEGTIA